MNLLALATIVCCCCCFVARADAWNCVYNAAEESGFAEGGVRLTLTKDEGGGKKCELHGADISPLTLIAVAPTSDTLRVTVRDAGKARWEVPAAIAHNPLSDAAVQQSLLRFEWTAAPFTFAVVRTDTGEALFNASGAAENNDGPLVFEDQFLSVSATLPEGAALYGLGERVGPLRVGASSVVGAWNADPWSDTGVLTKINLYGDQPFLLALQTATGAAHGVLFANSNAKLFSLSGESGALSMRAVGGVIDLFFFAGPRPEQVVQQLSSVVGRPTLPPYWALGYHQSGLGMSNAATLEAVLAKLDGFDLPTDCLWSDIDHMDRNRDFTFNPDSFNRSFATDFIERLHARGIKWTPILDHCIAIDASHEPYSLGVEMGVFVRDPADSRAVLTTKLWAGECAMVDFSHPNATAYWETLLRTFRKQGARFDGIWVDMDEPSNVCDGYCDGRTPTGPLNVPPWSPLVRDSEGWKLFTHSLPMDARQAAGLLYDTHDLYGYYEASATRAALRNILGEDQPFVLTRGNVFGSAQVAAHWLGDNSATWEQLRWSIPGVLAYNIFAAPFVGPDICGFIGQSDEELCTRWLEIGAFYPFSRNHASDVAAKPHFPWTYGERTLGIFKKVFSMRYRLLPYLHTLLVASNETGTPVWNPLFFDFAGDSQVHDIDRQALFGKALLLSPVLEKGAANVTAYIPPGSACWYDLWTLAPFSGSGWTVLPAPLDTIPVHIRGGTVIPMQSAARTATAARKTPFHLLVARDSVGRATGTLAFDSLRVAFSLDSNELVAKATSGSAPAGMPKLADIDVLGVSAAPTSVAVNGVRHTSFIWSSENHVLSITNLTISVDSFNVKWK